MNRQEAAAAGLLVAMASVVALVGGIAIGKLISRPGPDACHQAVHRSWEAFSRGDLAGYDAAMDDVVTLCLDEYMEE